MILNRMVVGLAGAAVVLGGSIFLILKAASAFQGLAHVGGL
jgi:hypothetical protein